MFFLALLLGIYGYGIFFLGLLGMLYPWPIGIWTIIVGCTLVWFTPKKNIHHIKFSKIGIINKTSWITLVTVVLLSTIAVVNFIGVLGPETAFDALWYHLTLPKLFIQEQSIQFIPGGLFYYSVMPKLGEMFFIPTLMFGNEIWAKGVQFFFGILTTVVIYKISRKYFPLPLSLLASLIFYSNIVVAWESSVAYIDLIRAFFEIMSLWAFLNWIDERKTTWLYLSAGMVGLAIATKLLALGTLLLFTILIVYCFYKKGNMQRRDMRITIVAYWLISIGIVSPWLLFSYFNTGNLFYPFFTSIYPVSQSTILLQNFIFDFFTVFLFADDPISPLYLIVLPVAIVYFSKLTFSVKLIGYYSLGALCLWYITPHTGGGRFILPYLPAFSILVIAVLEQVKQQKVIYNILLVSIFLIALLTIGYRGLAVRRYIPVILGFESKEKFLTQNLNFSYGDFYDTDKYFKKNIKVSDTILLYGFHNLYYIDFPFIDSSYVKKGDRFTYIATQNTLLPKRFNAWKVVYENPVTFVTLYKNGERKWTY